MNTVPYLFILLLSALLSHFLRFQHLRVEAIYVVAMLAGLLFASVVIPASGALRDELRNSLARRSRRMLAAWALVVTALVALAAMLKVSADYSRIWFGYWVLLGTVGLLVGQMLDYLLQTRYRRRHAAARSLVLVGAGRPMKRVEDQLSGVDGSAWRLVAKFGEQGLAADIRPLSELHAFIETHPVDDVWIAMPLDQPQLLDTSLEALKHSVVDVHVIPDFEHYRLLNQGISEWAGLPFINLSGTPMTGPELALKAAMDRLGALLLVVVLSPIFLLIALGVRLSGPGPILFRQARHGFGGEIIDVLKFRTMNTHAGAGGGVEQARLNDERVTRFGALLRRSSLDELPQLFNVLKGEMSLVGPRPHAREHNDLFQERIPRYMLRHKVKPGMTGWAQVNGLRGLTETDEKMALRIEHDLWYIQNWSIWLDITILLRTPFVMVHRNAF